MRRVRRICAIMLYSFVLFGLGVFTCLKAEEFFYPGDKLYLENQKKNENAGNESLQGAVPYGTHENPENRNTDETVMKEEELPVSFLEPQAVTANTVYLIDSYDQIKEQSRKEQVPAPDKYIGLNREQLIQALEEYQKSPSLEDLEKGFVSVELVSFSPQQVVVKKNYEKHDGFYLLNENNSVVVYDKSMLHKFMNTGIEMDDLPTALQMEIIQNKFVETEMDLYHFLESYSS